MQLARMRHFASALGLVAAVLGAGALAQQQPAGEPRATDPNVEARNVEVLLVEEEAPRAEEGARKVERVKVRVAAPTDGYWIGMQLDPASDALRSQLKLEGEQGLVVTELFPETPAVKSGFAKHDVIARVDEQAATDVETFNKVVQESKGEKELTVVLYRAGVPHAIKVTPAKRPGDQTFHLRLAPPPGQDDVIMEWVPKGLDLERPARIEFFNPGFVVGRSGELKVGDLPKNMTISISKSGDELAKVNVSKGEEKWEVTEKELDKLPPEVRGHVERMLRPGPWEARALHVRPQVEFAPRAVVTPRRAVPAVPPEATPVRRPMPATGDVDRRFDEVNERLEELQKALEALVKQHAEGVGAKSQQ